MDYHSSDLDYPMEADQPISREEFNDLSVVLKHLVNQSSPNIDLALQPTIIVLK
jgi:hypothetical protein